MLEGYRTHTDGKPILLPFKDILEYETKELLNCDIYLTMRERYNLNIDLRWSKDKCNCIILDYFKKRFIGVEPYGVWLCQYENDATELYGQGNNLLIKVLLPNNAVVASDLGYEGRLYVIHAGQTYSWETIRHL